MNKLRAKAGINDVRGRVRVIQVALHEVWGQPEHRGTWRDCKCLAEAVAYHIQKLRHELDAVENAIEETDAT